MMVSRTWKIALGALLALALGVAGYALNRPEPLHVSPAPVAPTPTTAKKVVGRSVQDRPIEQYSFGTGSKNVLFVGGIHGGYEWNSVLLAYEVIDHFTAHPEDVPQGMTVHIIPSANPDGVYAVLQKEGRFALADVPKQSDAIGRFNAREVDLNRNFDCKWKPESMWKGNVVSAGASAFSEPESQAIRAAVQSLKPAGVIFWHSQANAVYASECEDGILAGTRALMETYATAAKYPSVDTFDAYEVTGDAEGWLASIGIPAITVELATHETIEWEKNLAGIRAVIARFARD